MLKDNGNLLIGLPNVMTLRLIFDQLFFNFKRAENISKKIILNYAKESCHINAWDATRFLHLLGSVGFLMKKYVLTGGIPLPWILKKISIVGRFIPVYLNIKLPLIINYSYSKYFLFDKVRIVEIQKND